MGQQVNLFGSGTDSRHELFPGGLAGQVMGHVLETWKSFSLHQKVKLENRINASFCEALKKASEDAGRTWIIVPEYPINDPVLGVQKGRIDLCFIPPNHHGQKVFFTLECKRLRVRTKSGLSHYADRYVSKGVLKFVISQYSANHPCGGMLGYVMDGQLDEAFESVKREVEKSKYDLKMQKKPTCSPSSALPDYQYGMDTFHLRTDGEFTLHHLLVGVTR
jgi:hypothetical protein